MIQDDNDLIAANKLTAKTPVSAIALLPQAL
jgi:hypothetical protein